MAAFDAQPNGTQPLRGYRDEVADLKTTEPITSMQFVTQMVALGSCAAVAWLLLGLWEVMVWFLAFAAITAVEKIYVQRLDEEITRMRFHSVLGILFISAIIYDVMPVFLWFQENDALKFGSLAIIAGAMLNNLNARARHASILTCVQIPNAIMFLVIGGGYIWIDGWTPEAIATAVVALAIVAYFLVSLREANLKEKAAASTREQLRHAQKVEILANATGGVAHDFNNILSVVNGSLELLKDDRDPLSRQQLIDDALVAVENGSSLTRQMLAFGNRAPLVPKITDVGQALTTFKALAERVVPASLQIQLLMENNLPRIRVDQQTLDNALMNLVMNARHAMNDTGTLFIRAISISTQRGAPADTVVLSIIDAGVGIPPEIRDRIFEPFFTTRDVGKGSGLGLSMVRGFVEQSGGQIDIHSELGKGTTIDLLFPAVHVPVAPKKPTPVSQGTSKATGHIMVVDDNAELLALITRKLKSDGFLVSPFQSGDSAAAALRAGMRPNLIVSDIVMPGEIQGPHLLQIAKVECADLPVILMSGYADAKAKHDLGYLEMDGFLEKPIKFAELSAQASKALQRAAS